MEPKLKKVEVVRSPYAYRVFLAFLLSLVVGAGIWYSKNRQAQNIVSGVVSSPVEILKNIDGQTNILLLGIGGEGHEGGDLTDSILFVSLNLKDGKAISIPIPRDIWVPSMEAKINTAYHYGNQKKPGGGKDLVKSAVSEIIGLPIHYVVVLDFQGFVTAIDIIGGIDVVVDKTFDDYEYPIAGKENAEPASARYEHIYFDAGLTHMNGSTALKFARSRHAVGDEGTDFARGQRQQKIITAFKNKIFSADTIFNSEVIGKLKDNINKSVDTDIESLEQGSFMKVLLGLGSKNSITSVSISELFKSPKITKNYGGQWVLIPAISWDEVHIYVAKGLKNN